MGIRSSTWQRAGITAGQVHCGRAQGQALGTPPDSWLGSARASDWSHTSRCDSLKSIFTMCLYSCSAIAHWPSLSRILTAESRSALPALLA